MKKLALALATTAILGFAAPAFAADSDMTGSKPQTQSPSGQTSTPSAQTPTPSQTPSAQSQTPSTQTQTPSAQNQTPSMQNKASAQSQVNGKAKSKVSAKASNKAKMGSRKRKDASARVAVSIEGTVSRGFFKVGGPFVNIARVSCQPVYGHVCA